MSSGLNETWQTVAKRARFRQLVANCAKPNPKRPPEPGFEGAEPAKFVTGRIESASFRDCRDLQRIGRPSVDVGRGWPFLEAALRALAHPGNLTSSGSGQNLVF